MTFGDENTFKYYDIVDTYDTKTNEYINNSLNYKIFGDDSTYKYISNDIGMMNSISTPSIYKIFGDDETFISTTLNVLNNKETNNNKKIFGNNYDFISTISNDEEFIDAQSLLNLYNTNKIQSQNYRHSDCSKIDIGNLYSSYEIQSPCDMPHRRYARFCPCDNNHRGTCPNCYDNKNNNCNNNCNNNNKNKCKPNAEKLSRKIYQQLIYASSCVATIITQTNCPQTRQELIEIKRNLDKLGMSMLFITKALNNCDPICINQQNECSNNDFRHNINSTIELLSIITQNLVVLQKLPASKKYINAIVLITFGVISQQNRLICINNY